MKYSLGLVRVESLPLNGLAPQHTSTPDESDKRTPIGDFRRSDVAAAVAEFHTAFDLPQQSQPSINVEEPLEKLRISLLEEEVSELIAAINARDLTGIADALADITYVTYGTALTYGIDLDSVLGEVHRSNMSKLDRNGKPIIRADGKVVKSEHYSSPNIAAVLQNQTTR